MAAALAAIAIFAALAALRRIREWVPAGMKKISTDAVEYDLYIPSEWEEDYSAGVVTAMSVSMDRSSISVIAVLTSMTLTKPSRNTWNDNKGAFTSFSLIWSLRSKARQFCSAVSPQANLFIPETLRASRTRYAGNMLKRRLCLYTSPIPARAERYDRHLEKRPENSRKLQL